MLNKMKRIIGKYDDMNNVTMGIWTFYKDRLTIEDDSGYVVSLETIDSTNEFLDWVEHILEKCGFDPINFVLLLVYAADWNFKGKIKWIFSADSHDGEDKENIKWRK